MKQKDLFIYSLKAPFLQSVIDAAKFHSKYMTGFVELEKLQDLASKMARKYNLDLDKSVASRLRKTGAATCRMLVYKLPVSYSVESDDMGIPMPNSLCQWIIFSSDGEHPLGDIGDTWRNHFTDRVQIFGGLELFRHTRPRAEPKDGEPAPKNTAPSWSVRFESKHYDNLRNSLISAIKTHQDWKVESIVRDARKTPGFAGVREQLKKLMALIKGTWARHRGNSGMPELPTRFGYVRRIKSTKIRIITALRTLRQEQERYRLQRASILAESEGES